MSPFTRNEMGFWWPRPVKFTCNVGIPVPSLGCKIPGEDDCLRVLAAISMDEGTGGLQSARIYKVRNSTGDFHFTCVAMTIVGGWRL